MRVFLAFFLVLNLSAQAQYFPPAAAIWQNKDPNSLGLSAPRLNDALAFAGQHEYSGSRDLRMAILEGFKNEPYHEILGPTKKRGGPTGLILKSGYIVAQWGDIDRVDMTFSVTKSFLSTIYGLAEDRDMISDIDDFVANYVWDCTFEGAHNGQVTWRHLLTQSSDWSGAFFGVKDWADRPPKTGSLDDWKNRDFKTPGTFFEYNDVRVNVLAYSLLQVWRRSLPEVLKTELMDPIGATSTWRWYGYDRAWTDLDGYKVQTVSGGGHSGGGLFISARDQARFGLLFSRNGSWEGKQLLSGNWIDQVRTSSQANESYGYMWWLNKGDRKWAGVSDESIYYASGFGGNFIVIDNKNDLVIVTRWLEPSQIGTMVELVQKAVK